MDETAGRPLTLAEQLDGLRRSALAAVKDERGTLAQLEAERESARGRLQDACAAAIAMGITAEDVAEVAGVSAGTIRSWAPKRAHDGKGE